MDCFGFRVSREGKNSIHFFFGGGGGGRGGGG